MCQTRKKNRLLRSAARYAILIIEKGKARNTRSTLNNDKLYALQHQPFTIRSSGRLFSSLEDLVNETSKGNQQDTYLD